MANITLSSQLRKVEASTGVIFMVLGAETRTAHYEILVGADGIAHHFVNGRYVNELPAAKSARTLEALKRLFRLRMALVARKYVALSASPTDDFSRRDAGGAHTRLHDDVQGAAAILVAGGSEEQAQTYATNRAIDRAEVAQGVE